MPHFALTPAQWRYATCTTIASLTALGIAGGIGMGNPWWAAMAVWIVARPGRGLLLERALFQLLGLSAGALAGVAILHLSHGSQVIDVLLLALLLGLCTYVSSVWRHTRSFGAAFCGITATVIVVLGASSEVDPDTLALTRALDQLIGILSACLAIAVFNPPGPGQALIDGIRGSAGDSIDVAMATLRDPVEPVARRNDLLAALARVEMTAEDATAGSFSQRRKLRGVFELLGSVLGLLTASHVLRRRIAPIAEFIPDLIALLDNAKTGLRRATDSNSLTADLADLKTRLEHRQPGAGAMLQGLGDALLATVANHRSLAGRSPVETGLLVHHRDRRGAWRGSIRTTLAVLATGAIWLATGWQDSQIMMLLVGVALCMFAASDTAPHIMRQAFFGAIIGLLFATAWRVWLDPVLPPGIQWTVLAAAPILFTGALLMVQNRWMFVGLLANLVFLLVSVPTYRSPTGSIASTALFLLLGVAIAELSFRWPLGTSPTLKRAALRAAADREVAELSAGMPENRRRHHRAQLRHIVLLAIGHDGCTAAAAQAGFDDLLRAEP